MQYFIVFLEGIVTFISPCILPMLPIYLSYLAGNIGPDAQEIKKSRLMRNALGFVIGFSILFISLGATAGTLGKLISGHTTLVNLAAGAVMILFGLNFMGIIKIGFLNQTKSAANNSSPTGFFSAISFGFLFALSWSPCVGAFLGSALALASTSGETGKGVLMLAAYSAGLGIPFLVSALLLEKLQAAFGLIKDHYIKINFLSGLLLIMLGILTALGMFNILAGWLT
jgi:cytochrome c-type biogenesis protein